MKSTHIKTAIFWFVMFIVVMAVTGWLLKTHGQVSTFYVSPTGDDTNPGTLALPFKSLDKACGLANPGTTIIVRGGSYLGNYCHAQAQGTLAAPITIKGYPGEPHTFTGTHPYGVTLNIFGSFWIIDGIHIENTSLAVQININNAKDITVRNSVLRNNSGGELLKATLSNRITVEANTFDTTGTPLDMGQGDCLPILGSTQVLIQNNSFTKCGHAAVIALNSNQVMSSKIIVRNNVIDQKWGGGVYMIKGTTDTLVEGNRISHTGEQVAYQKACLHPAGERGIWRRNICERTGANQDAITIAGYFFGGIVQSARQNRIYNGVVYRAGRSPIFMVQKDQGRIEDNKIVNMILYRNKVSGTAEPYWPACNCYISVDSANSDVPWPNFPNGNHFQGNIIRHADDSGDKPNEPRLIYHQTRVVTDYVWSLLTAQAQLAPFFANNRDVNPGFKDAEGGDFSLVPGSAAIDTGQNLTVTTAAGIGNVIPVDDPYFFFDGYGMVSGDVIRVGASTVTITSVDNAGKRLTVDRAITFNAGDPVNLNFSGSGPDVGALEFSSSSPTPSPTPAPSPMPTPQPTALTADFPWPTKLAEQRILREQIKRNGFVNCQIYSSRYWCERP